MSEINLAPNSKTLAEEYLLVQAWKKTANYIRNHTWFSDPLDLDMATVNLPQFVSNLRGALSKPSAWRNDDLRFIPAPKSQNWQIKADGETWSPSEPTKTAAKIRPLAHVSLKDQVAATAAMLCLADRVETLQGDPRADSRKAGARAGVTSYGNRLYCDEKNKRLSHRWASAKLYRGYYNDYANFVSRPEIVAEQVPIRRHQKIVIVQSDLKQFYDRVRPSLFASRLDSLMKPGDDPVFFAFVRRLMNWKWNDADLPNVESYASATDLDGFSTIVLPQGLVSAGFFSNVVLLQFDKLLRRSLQRHVINGIILRDVSRYVDDLRLVLSVESRLPVKQIEAAICNYLQRLLDKSAPGLLVARDKTHATVFGGEERPLVRQSWKMRRIQTAVSGGFDAIAGVEILDSIQGLVKAQRRFALDGTESVVSPLHPTPDVRDETVARFAAGRFRTTFRSLRPLLPEGGHLAARPIDEDDEQSAAERFATSRSQKEVDDEARTFALGLIDEWVGDPSNVRLLRIGLDLWPSSNVLKRVLQFIRPYWNSVTNPTAAASIVCYCLSEIFRAGATETGFVEDDEQLPDDVDVVTYRRLLRREATKLVSLSGKSVPWYLRQQALLYLLASGSNPRKVHYSSEVSHYRDLNTFIGKNGKVLAPETATTMALIARRSFLDRNTSVKLYNASTVNRDVSKIARLDPAFALEIIASTPSLKRTLSSSQMTDLCLSNPRAKSGWVPVSSLVLDGAHRSPLRNELSLITFAQQFIIAVAKSHQTGAIPPSHVFAKLRRNARCPATVENIRLTSLRGGQKDSMYRPPNWCDRRNAWRFQLG